MSHELRTPLNAIIGYTGTLLMRLPGPLTADQERQLRTIQHAGRDLLSLLNDLLNLAKVEAGKMELRLEAVSAPEAIDEVVMSLRPLAKEKNIRLEPVAGKTATVRADRRALSQILMNLVGNAIKFSEKGAVRLDLEEVLESGRIWVAIHVTDDGVGIPHQDQIRLFQAFEQLDLSTAPTSGSGAGLRRSQKLAVAIGGRIEVASEYGKGSRFTLLIPKG